MRREKCDEGVLPPNINGPSHHPFSPPILVYKPFIWVKDRQLDFGISDMDEILLKSADSCWRYQLLKDMWFVFPFGSCWVGDVSL